MVYWRVVYFDDVDLIVLDGVLHVHQATDTRTWLTAARLAFVGAVTRF